VVSVGGSVLVTGDDDAEYLTALGRLVRRLAARHALVVTTGGGRTARELIELGRALGMTEVELDEVGIDVTRTHARLLAAAVGPPTRGAPIPTSVAGAAYETHRGAPVILGGTEPGHTTDAVAALVAVRLGADRVVNATSVDGIYDHDPRRDPAAKRFDRLSFEEFRRLVERNTDGTAGQQFVFDRLGAEALARARIPLVVVHGRDLANLERAIGGLECHGTRVA
jgi:uridylate kinase